MLDSQGAVVQRNSRAGMETWTLDRGNRCLRQRREAPLAVLQVFSIAVFGPIVNEGYVNSDSGPELRCVFNGNAGACRFGVVLGLGAFIACVAFLVLDVRFQQISSVRDRRRAVLLDLGFSGGRGRR